MFRILILLALALPALHQSSYAETPANEVPLYEGIPKTPSQREADSRFIAEAEKAAGGKVLAAKQLIASGWQAIDAHDTAKAIRRFNQAFLLTPSDYQIYWGLGMATAIRGDFPRAERLFSLGLEYNRRDVRFLSDAGFCLQQAAFHAASDKNIDPRAKLAQAKKLYQEALAQDPQTSLPHARLAVLAFFDKNCAEARRETERAKQLGGEGLDRRFVADLEVACAPQSSK